MKSRILLVAVAIALLSAGCKKYDDDMCHPKKPSQPTSTVPPS